MESHGPGSRQPPGISAMTIGLGLREQGLHRAPPHAPARPRLAIASTAPGGTGQVPVDGRREAVRARGHLWHVLAQRRRPSVPAARRRRGGFRAHGRERPERGAHLHRAASLAARHGARTRTVGDGRARLGATRGLSREPCASALDRGSGAVGRGRLRRPSRGAVLRSRQRDTDPRRAVGRPGADREVHRAPARRRAAGRPWRAVHIRQLPVDRVPPVAGIRPGHVQRLPRESRATRGLSGQSAEPGRGPAAADGRAGPRQPRTRKAPAGRGARLAGPRGLRFRLCGRVRFLVDG